MPKIKLFDRGCRDEIARLRRERISISNLETGRYPRLKRLRSEFKALLAERQVIVNPDSLSAVKREIILLTRLMRQEPKNLVVKTPSPWARKLLADFYTGSEQDQAARLKDIASVIMGYKGQLPVMQTKQQEESPLITELWEALFAAIASHDRHATRKAFNRIGVDNPLMDAICMVHDRSFIEKFAVQAAAIPGQRSRVVADDVVINNRIFEFLVRDIASSLSSNHQFHFDFGLPTHHAGTRGWSGFCLLNKMAIMLARDTIKLEKSPRCIAIGLDINRDDGLNNVLLSPSFQGYRIDHIDVFSSRVYPWHSHDDIARQYHAAGYSTTLGIRTWQHAEYRYTAVDIQQIARGTNSIHPVMLLVLNQLKTLLAEAEAEDEPVILMLPVGWDSHGEEMAACGCELDRRRLLTGVERQQYRFNDEDFAFFNHHLMRLINHYQPIIEKVYWQLEGGYTPRVNQRMVKGLMEALCSFVSPQLQPDSRPTPQRPH